MPDDTGRRVGRVTARLSAAIGSNPRCVGGLMANCRAFMIDRGPSGGLEALALLGADDLLANRFWYGHAKRHPERADTFVALLSLSSRFINAVSVPLLFARYHHWTEICPSFQPCAARGERDVYAETGSFEAAGVALAEMIERFDPDARSAREGTPFENDAIDYRILDVYGIAGRAAAARWPPAIPDITPLRLLKTLD